MAHGRRNAYGQTESLLRLENFSKWLFATAATVGTLGTALGANGFGELEDTGQYLFSAAVIALALSLACGTFALVPRVRKVKPNVIGSPQEAVRSVIRVRARW